jgi:REP element-mobilizing transposase RayT
MPQSYTNLLYHCIFSTKNRLAQIDDELKSQLVPYLGGIVRSLNGTALAVNGTADHMHLLIALPPTLAIADGMRLIKTNSSKWVHETWTRRSDFAWQTGYGAFSVSHSNVESVRAYIAHQEEHHRRLSFKEEFLAFLKKHDVQYDERYIWQ